MPQTDPEERKNYNKEYYKKTRKPLTPEQKEKKRLYAIKYREEHKEELALKNKLEIEEMKRQWKEYIQTDEYKNKIADRKKAYEKIVASRKR